MQFSSFFLHFISAPLTCNCTTQLLHRYLLSGTHQIDVALFVQSLAWMQVEDVDAEETECILANMINDGRIKGYLSHAHSKLVVSKKDAFPPLTASFC